MEFDVKITGIKLSKDRLDFSYSILDGLVTGRYTVLAGEYSEEKLWDGIYQDVISNKENIDLLNTLIAKWENEVVRLPWNKEVNEKVSSQQS